MSKLFSGKIKKKKYCSMLSAEKFAQSAKVKSRSVINHSGMMQDIHILV